MRKCIIGVETLLLDGWVVHLIADPDAPEQPIVRRTDVDRAAVVFAVSLLESCDANISEHHCIGEICRKILTPLLPQLEHTAGIYLTLHGLLQNLPITTTPVTNGISIAEMLPVSLIPSISFVQLFDEQPWQTGRSIAVLQGVEVGDEQIIEHASEAIRRSAGALTGERIVITRDPADIRNAAVLIVVAHGTVRQGFDCRPCLHLMNNTGTRKSIDGSELSALVPGCRIAFLAVCRSSTVDSLPDNEPIGLAWPLIERDCRAVIAPLWEVRPSDSVSIVSSFIDALFRNKNAGEAFGISLRSVARDRRQGIHDSLCAFTLLGDWRAQLSRP